MAKVIHNSWWAVLLVVLCVAPTAFSQSMSLQLNDPPSNNIMDNIYVGPYGATNTQTGGSMQVICDDFRDESNTNNWTYTVNTFSNLGNTLWGSMLLAGGDTMAQVTALYQEAGWLALGTFNSSGTQQGYYQYALWAVFQPSQVLNWLKTNLDFAACQAIFGNSCTSTHAAAGSLLAQAQQYGSSGNYSNLVILTPQGCGLGFCPEQELFALVPEGGSRLLYLLLAGLACLFVMKKTRPQAVANA